MRPLGEAGSVKVKTEPRLMLAVHREFLLKAVHVYRTRAVSARLHSVWLPLEPMKDCWPFQGTDYFVNVSQLRGGVGLQWWRWWSKFLE